MGPTLRAGRPRVGRFSFHGASAAHEFTVTQAARRNSSSGHEEAPMQALVSCCGVGQLRVIHTQRVEISGVVALKQSTTIQLRPELGTLPLPFLPFLPFPPPLPSPPPPVPTPLHPTAHDDDGPSLGMRSTCFICKFVFRHCQFIDFTINVLNNFFSFRLIKTQKPTWR